MNKAEASFFETYFNEIFDVVVKRFVVEMYNMLFNYDISNSND